MSHYGCLEADLNPLGTVEEKRVLMRHVFPREAKSAKCFFLEIPSRKRVTIGCIETEVVVNGVGPIMGCSGGSWNGAAVATG